MKILLIGIIIVLILLGVWIIGTWFVIRGLDSPKYKVLEKKSGYEIRKYDSYIVAEVELTGEYQQALSNGFRLLAGYIFGGNTKKESISMTTPVSESTKVSEKISMTTPVSEIGNDEKRIIQFSMPQKYTLDTLPSPNDTQVKIREIEGFIAAVLRYTGYATEERVAEKKKELFQKLSQDTIIPSGDATSAQYNPPLSFPWLRRNEIIIPIEY